jgi:hypothetical protein
LPDPPWAGVACSGVGRADSARAEEAGAMTGTRLLVQRRALFDRLTTDAAGAENKIVKPAFLPLLADIQTETAFTAAVLADPHTLGGAL